MSFQNWHRRQAFLGLLAPIFLWIPNGLAILVSVMALHIIGLTFSARTQWQVSLKTGLTNALTLFRILLVFVIAIVFDVMDPWWIAILLWCAAILDGVDGFVARKWRTQTPFGALIDEEGDALFMLFISLVLIEGESMPWWFFLAGWLRYLVLLMRLLFGNKSSADLKIPGARLIGGWSFGLAPLLFLLPNPFHLILGWAILLALIYSLICEMSYYVRSTADIHHL